MVKKWFIKQKTIFFIFLILAVIVWVLQSIILKDHLRYGFRDGDWWIIRRFISLGDVSLNHLINAFKLHAVYTYQIYYAGFLTKLYGLSFPNLHQASHFFKFLATLSVFPLVFFITKNKMMAFITTIIYTVAYPTSGALYMFLTGAYFIAIIFLNFFLMSYWYVLNQKEINLGWILLSLFLFLSTLALNTERMYSLLPLILIIEFLWVWKNHWKRIVLKTSLIRVTIFLSPLIVFYLIYSIWFKSQVISEFFTPQFLKTIHLRFETILLGNWQLMLYPFASFGSMFLYGDSWKIFGNFNIISLLDFLLYFISKPLIIFAIPTIILMKLISKKSIRLILATLIPVLIFGLIIFLMASHWLSVDKNIRIHFDTNFVGIPALFGFYILSLSFSFFLAWLENKDKRNLLLPILLGSGISFLFIFFTWIGSDLQLLFMGPQRYLTTPAIGSSLVMASLITLIFSSLRKITILKNLAWLSLLILIPIIFINAKVSQQFFDYELNFVGMDAKEQTRMKNKFWSITPNISTKEASLFYFDETRDLNNGYFNESAVLAGFEDWTQFDKGQMLVVNRPDPGMIRTNVQCLEHTHQSCIKMMKEGLDTVDGEYGIWYKDIIRGQTEPRFYKLSNFYALRFINKDVVDIREEILKELGVTDD